MYNASEQILLKKLVISKNEETILKGDLNLDGRRNLADTVLFQPNQINDIDCAVFYGFCTFALLFC